MEIKTHVLTNPQNLSEERKLQARKNIDLGNVENTSDMDKPVSTAQQAAIDALGTTVDGKLAGKVDKEAGKGLSTNDFDDTYKSKVDASYEVHHSHTNKSELDQITGNAIASAETTDEGKTLVLHPIEGEAVTFSGEQNAINTISQNGEPLPIVNKNVEITETIKSISVNTNPLVPDANHNVDITIESPVTPYGEIPAMNGTGSAGSSALYSRGDHVHPSDTTKADKDSDAKVDDLAKFDSNGNPVDSGIAVSELSKLHVHENKSILDNTTASYTVDDKDKLDNIAEGATKVEASETNGNVKIDGTETTVYTHPTTEATAAAAVKVGKDSEGHVVLGDPLTKSDVGLEKVDNTSDDEKPVSTATQTALDDKVDKVQGKDLSTNDYSNADKDKLTGIEAGAQVNKIETIKVNGTAQTITEKSVDIDLSGYKQTQQAVVDPSVGSDPTTEFIATVSQDANGVMTATKQRVQDGTTEQKGIVQLEDAVDSYSTSKAATPNSVKTVYDLANGKQDALEFDGEYNAATNKVALESTVAAAIGVLDAKVESKADKVSEATDGNFAGLDANGNLVDSTYKPGDFKTKQTAVVDPTASGNSLDFIATASQDANGEMTVEKKTVQDGTINQKGVVQLEDSYSSTSTTKAATSNSVKGAYDALDTAKADKVTGATDGDLAGLDANGNLTDAGVKPSDFIKGVQKNGTDLTPDQDQKVNVVVNDAKLNVKLGSGNAVEKFSADASQDSTIEIPVASYDDTATPTTYSEGLMTGQEKEKLANVDAGAQINVIEKVQKNGTDLSISNKTVNVPVGTGMLKTKLGSAQSATDLFGADSSTDATLEIPMASADTTSAEPVYTEGLMSGQDKEKLDGIEAGAEENDVETVSIGGGTPISPTANTTNIDIPMAGYTSGATPTYTDGAMAGQDKKKLDDLKNFSSVVISDGVTPTPTTTTIVPADHNSALTFKAGTNVTLSAEPSTDPDTIVISATGGGDPVTVSGGKGISVTPSVDPTTSVTDYEVSVSGAIGCIGGKSSVNVTASDCDAIALPMSDAFDSGNDRFIIQEDQTDHHVYLYALKTVSGQTPATRVDGVDMFTVTFNVNLTRSAIQSGVTQHGFYGIAGIKVLRKHSSVVTLADSSESYAAEVGAASINLTVTIQNNSGTETTIGGKAYYGYRFVYYGDAPAIDSTTQLPVETIDLVSRLTSVEETVGIAEYSGIIPTYTAGTAIDMTSDVVSVQYNRGLMVNSNNQLEVRLGEGLDYLPDPQNPAIIAIGIHNDVEEVVENVRELENTINTTVTTNMDFSDITGKFDLAVDGSHTGDGVLLGYTFTVPLANKLFLEDVANEWVTKIGVYAAQTYSQNYCIIGIYEFDFNQHPVPTTVNPSGYAGYTVPLCDTGRVKLHAGLNEFSIKHMNANGETELSFKPDCIYYAAIYVSKNCGQNLSLAGKPGYNDPFNDSLPVMSMDMCNLNLDLSDSSKTATELDAISFNDFGWWGGGSGSSQTQAYHECPNAHRFFMMVRNVKAAQSN